MAINARARSLTVRPASSAMPYSVTTMSASLREVVTMPRERRGTMRDTVPLCAVDSRTRMPRLRGSRFVGLRRVPPELLGPLRRFLDGKSDVFLAPLVEQLLESRPARREAAEVQDALRVLADFHRRDAVRLREARRAVGREGDFVPQAERDALFIQARMPVVS